MKPIAILGMSVVLVCGSVANAHKTPCAHRHHGPNFPDDLIECNPEGVACTSSGRSGTCKQKQSTKRAWCPCEVPSGGCLTVGANALDPDIIGLPGQGETRRYTAVFHEVNLWTVFDGDELLAEWEAGENPLQGSLELFFGSFAEPTAVPVTLTDLSLSLPSVTVRGQETGPNTLRLPGGAPPELVYDSTTGVIEPLAGEEGVALALDNNLGVGLSSVWYLEARIQPPDGEALLLVQGIASGPAGGPVPASTKWSALAAVMVILGIGAWVIRRGRREGHGVC